MGMKSEQAVEEFEARIKGSGDEHNQRAVLLYEACVPMSFWEVVQSDVEHNRDLFESSVLQYCEKLHMARTRGYSLLCMGSNGTGKTLFISYILKQVIEYGYTAYYTTVLDYDHNIRLGMNNSEVASRLEWMLGSDFLAFDELIKERYKDGDNWMRLEIERILKYRNDNNLPTLVGTNASLEEIGDAYGASICSVLNGGKYKHLLFSPGDYRQKQRKQMEEEMGYAND
jgi:DNA replication protein DnaC